MSFFRAFDLFLELCNNKLVLGDFCPVDLIWGALWGALWGAPWGKLIAMSACCLFTGRGRGRGWAELGKKGEQDSLAQNSSPTGTIHHVENFAAKN